ncbi:hypothetical protein BGX33_008028 [Mortierella sp. NVP41]|nr:hypothetical protein BGX33_008028 [Mortierella sp. NVP41]
MSSRRIVTGDTIFASQLFTRQELVGRGAYGAVYKGVENATGQVVAIKVLNLDTEEEDVSDIQREIATLSQLKNCDSQNITRYHGSFLNGTKLWIVMDYAAGGSIRSLLQALTRIDEKCIAVIAREVLQALGYLHKHGIIHRDIKAANILLTDEGRVQLCDFGVAGQVTMNSLKRNSFVGTPYWMAPEVIREGQTYDFKADIWSLGITIYEIATGNPPFADQDPMRAVSLIPKSRPAQLEGDWSPAMKEFVALCLHEEPNERPSAEDLLKTKWIKSTSKSPLTLLKDLVAKYEQHKIEAALNKEETSSDIDIDHELESFDMEVDPDAWRFDTAKTLPPMTPSRASSLSKPDSKSDHPNGTKSPALSAQDSGVVIQGRNGKSLDHSQHNQDNATSIPSPSATSPTVKAKSPTSPRNSKKAVPLKSQPAVITHESHPLLRLFMDHKSASEEDVSTSHSLLSPQGPHMGSAPMTLTIPNLEEITNARLASRSPVPDSNMPFDQLHPSQHQYPGPASSRQQESGSSRMPFGFNMSKPFRFDRRPSAPVLMGSAPGQDHPFHNHHILNRGPGSSSALTSPRALAPASTQSSLLANVHQKQSQQDSDSSQHSGSKAVHSHEIVLPNQLQGVQSHNSRPSSTPASPAIPPVGMMESTALTGTGSSLLNPSQEPSRLGGPRRPSPSLSYHQQEQQQQHPIRHAHDARNNLPPQIPHRKASLDFSQSERYSHLRPSLPIRPPSAASARSSTFHGLDSTPTTNISHGSDNHSSLSGSFVNSLAGLSSSMAALSMQPINISEEKLPPFGHSPAHLRMLNALPDNSAPSINGVHRGSITSDKDGFSPASSVNGDQASGSLHSGSVPNHGASSSASSVSSVSSASLPNSAAINGSFGVTGPGHNPGVVMARPGLRTVGSSENFARRIRSASMLRRTEEQENMSKSAFQPSRPPQATGAPPGQQQPMQHYQQQHQHQHQQQQYSYNHEPGSADIGRYRRASSPRRRSISMTNLNGLSVIMIPPKKGSDDYSTNPLLLPPSPSTTRFIAPPSMNVTALSSSPLRPTLHSMASSSSLSSSFGSVSGAFPGNQMNGGRNSNGPHGLQQHQQQQQQQQQSHQHSSAPVMLSQGTSLLSSSVPSTVPSSPPTPAQITNNNNHNSNIAAANGVVNGNNSHNSNMASTYNETLTATPAKSFMNHSGASYHQGSNYPGHTNNNMQLNPSGLGHLASHNGSTTTLVGSNSQQNLSQHLNQQHQNHHLQQQLQHQQQLQMQRQLQGSPMHMLIVTPEPRLLQMDALRRNEDLVEELQLTMNDLSQWLEVFETGIKTVRSL